MAWYGRIAWLSLIIDVVIPYVDMSSWFRIELCMFKTAELWKTLKKLASLSPKSKSKIGKDIIIPYV